MRKLLADIAALQAEGFDSIAVITKTAAESREAYESLTDSWRRSSAAHYEGDADFEKGMLVIPVYLAKGVEFDAVLIYDASPEAYSGKTNASFFIQHVRGPCIGFIFTRRVIGRRSCRHCLRIGNQKSHRSTASRRRKIEQNAAPGAFGEGPTHNGIDESNEPAPIPTKSCK